MRKIVIHSPGNYQALKIEEFPDLVPGSSEILVDIQFSGINYADVLIRWGVYESAKEYVGWPITPGFEYSGTVKTVGSGVTRFKPGDRVFGITRFGAYATQIIAPEDQLFHIPAELTPEQAAALPAVYMTAFHGLFQNIVIKKGAVILVHSAAGGVGSALLQLSRASGFKTIGVVGRSHKVDAAFGFGATWVIDKSTQDLWREVEKIAPKGVSVVFDANGVSTLWDSYEHLAPMGKLVCYGFHSMLPKQGGKLNYLKLAMDYIKTPRFNPLNMTAKNRSLVTFNLSFLFDEKEMIQEGMNQLLAWLKTGIIAGPKVVEFKFENVAEAHRRIESGETVGKIVLKV